jgi:hypothetical protein
MVDLLHPYETQELDYFYVLTPHKDGTTTIDGIGYHKATAVNDFDSLACGKGYKVCFDHLSVQDRPLEAWGDPLLFEKCSFAIKPHDEFEPHKHPNVLKKRIEQGESFEWFCKTSYRLKTPTEEAINQIRQSYWWDSNDKAAITFYHHARPIKCDQLRLYVPTWLANYENSYTYLGFSVDSEPLDENVLASEGLAIKRQVLEDANPRQQLKEILPGLVNEFSHWLPSYSALSLEVSGSSLGPTAQEAVMTVGIISPQNAVWEKYA